MQAWVVEDREDGIIAVLESLSPRFDCCYEKRGKPRSGRVGERERDVDDKVPPKTTGKERE